MCTCILSTPSTQFASTVPINMKLLLVCLCLIAAASAAPPKSKKELAAIRALPALQHVDVRDEFGQYSLRYVTAEGTVVTETGRLVPTANGTDYVLVTEKEVSYVGDDGKTYTTKYSAGIDGVKIEGSHIPVAPEPEADLPVSA